MTFYDFFSSFWWLIFPIGAMVSMAVRTIMNNNYNRERLRIIKTYADQGKDIPESLSRDL